MASVHRPGGPQSTQAPIGSVTAALLSPSQGGITAPKPPAGPPAATTSSRSGASSAAYSVSAWSRTTARLPTSAHSPRRTRARAWMKCGDVGLAPAGGLQMVAKLPGDDQRVVAGPDRVVPHVGAHLGGEGFQDLLGVGGPFVHDLARRAGRHDGDGGDFPRQAALDVQRVPGGVFLVLGDAVAEFSGMAEGGTIDAAGPHLAGC